MSRFEFRPIAELEAERDHPLARVEGEAVPGGKLHLWLGPKIVGGRYFRVSLDGDETSADPFLQGLQNSGPYPGQNWIEVFDLNLPPELAGQDGWEQALKPYILPLADTIPAGGHLMIEYEKPLWRSTQLGLLAGVPPMATPMGELLYHLGAGSSFKDWYFPEGGQEGGRKLQGNKAMSGEHARETAAKRAAELQAFLDHPAQGDPAIDTQARDTARRLLSRLR
jgi:hypothetical protein